MPPHCLLGAHDHLASSPGPPSFSMLRTVRNIEKLGGPGDEARAHPSYTIIIFNILYVVLFFSVEH